MALVRTCGECRKKYTIINANQMETRGRSYPVTCPHCYKQDGEVFMEEAPRTTTEVRD